MPSLSLEGDYFVSTLLRVNKKSYKKCLNSIHNMHPTAKYNPVTVHSAKKGQCQQCSVHARTLPERGKISVDNAANQRIAVLRTLNSHQRSHCLSPPLPAPPSHHRQYQPHPLDRMYLHMEVILPCLHITNLTLRHRVQRDGRFLRLLHDQILAVRLREAQIDNVAQDACINAQIHSSLILTNLTECIARIETDVISEILWRELLDSQYLMFVTMPLVDTRHKADFHAIRITQQRLYNSLILQRLEKHPSTCIVHFVTLNELLPHSADSTAPFCVSSFSRQSPTADTCCTRGFSIEQ